MPASAATRSASSEGQTQSPGYQPKRRRHPWLSRGTSPVASTGSRNPHSRQYSWLGSYGVPQRGQSTLLLPAVRLDRLGADRRGVGLGNPVSVRRRLCGLAAARTELGVGRKRMAALRAADDRLLADGAAAVGAEMRAPDDRRTAFAAARRRPAAGRRGGQHRVELVQPGLEVGDVARVLAEQVFPELLAAVHLHREAAQVAQQLLSRLQDRATLTPECARRSGAPHGRCGWGSRSLLLATPPPQTLRPESWHENRL